jgi:DNA-binding response OmpR family regulator
MNLEKEGFEVDYALDGEKAIALIKINSYDLVIADLVMPKVDGWQLCQHLKAGRRKIPVIAMSMLDEVENNDFDAFLLKPFELSQLINEVKRLLGESNESSSS